MSAGPIHERHFWNCCTRLTSLRLLRYGQERTACAKPAVIPVPAKTQAFAIFARPLQHEPAPGIKAPPGAEQVCLGSAGNRLHRPSFALHAAGYLGNHIVASFAVRTRRRLTAPQSNRVPEFSRDQSQGRVQRSKAGDHDPKTEVPATVAWGVPDAKGATHADANVVERTAAHNTSGVARQVVVHLRGVIVVIVQPLGPAPFPHVPGQIGCAAHRIAVGKAAHRRRAVDAGFVHIAVLTWFIFIAPRINPAVGVARGPFPLGLAGQADRQTRLFR